jgi:fumarate hydratase class II
MLVTALSPHVGYDQAGPISHKPHDGTSRGEAALAPGVSAADCDGLIHPGAAIRNSLRDRGLNNGQRSAL